MNGVGRIVYAPDYQAFEELRSIAKASRTEVTVCNCVGPKDGEPLCRCRMRSLQVRGGRYVEIIDHGPAPGRDDSSSD